MTNLPGVSVLYHDTVVWQCDAEEYEGVTRIYTIHPGHKGSHGKVARITKQYGSATGFQTNLSGT